MFDVFKFVFRRIGIFAQLESHATVGVAYLGPGRSYFEAPTNRRYTKYGSGISLCENVSRHPWPMAMLIMAYSHIMLQPTFWIRSRAPENTNSEIFCAPPPWQYPGALAPVVSRHASLVSSVSLPYRDPTVLYDIYEIIP